MCIVLCWIFNIRGMRPAVGLSYVVGALMIFPILVIAIGGFITGDFSNHQIDSNFVAANVEFYGDSATFFNQFVMIMVWLYILGWSTYGPEAGATFAPEYKDTANDTRKALASVGALNVVLSILLPIVVLGTIGYDGLFNDLTGVVWLTDVVNSIAGEGFGKFLVVCLCGGLLLSMNTATMDGSRALYALSEEKMTIRQLGVLNKRNVPGRAMTVDMLLNIFLLLYFQNIYFILAAGNLGYMLSHVIALSGILWLRRDRPNWPRPIKLGKAWMWMAGLFCALNSLFIIFGLYGLKYTGYGFDYLSDEYAAFLAGTGPVPSPTARVPEIVAVGVGVLLAGVLGYIIAQKQWGKSVHWKDPSDEQPTQEAIDGAAAAGRGRQLPQRLAKESHQARAEGRGNPPLVVSGNTIVWRVAWPFRSPSGASAARPTRQTSETSSSVPVGDASTRRRSPRATSRRSGSTRRRQGSTSESAPSSSWQPA